MCLTPKVLYIKSKAGTPFKVAVPCGHCRECQNSLRAGLVARFKNEQKYLPYVKFVTLTYNNVELLNLYYKRYNWLYVNKADFLKKMRIDENNNKLYRYGKFLLSRDHAKEFVSKFQKEYEKLFKCKVKYYLCAEYGTLHFRPHYHIAIFFKYRHTDIMLHDFITRIWKYGDVQVGDCTDGGMNYVAKHCYKEDCGSEIQKKMAPIFSLQSRYQGGIGCHLVEDKELLHNYQNDIKFGRIKGTKYKYALPRYVRRKLEPDGLSDTDLHELEKKSISNLTSQMCNNGYDLPDANNIELSSQYSDYYRNNKAIDYKNKFIYNLHKFNKKYLVNQKKHSKFVHENKKDISND